MKRVFLFVATNLAVVLLLGIVARLLGADRFLAANGLALGPLLIFAALFGFGGSFISLLMSKWLAKRSVGAVVIDGTEGEPERFVHGSIARLSASMGLPMPEVAIYDDPTMNAFATGPSRSNSLVAVSTGLLRSMSRDEIEAVLGHELAHIANGDMVTMTLLQGVLNTFVIFFARVAGFFVDRMLSRDDRGPGIGYMVTSFLFEMVFGLIASVIVAAYSRRREFRADAGSAGALGPRPMIAALRRLGAQERPQPQGAIAALAIDAGGISRLFATHPPLEERIAALEGRR